LRTASTLVLIVNPVSKAIRDLSAARRPLRAQPSGARRTILRVWRAWPFPRRTSRSLAELKQTADRPCLRTRRRCALPHCGGSGPSH